MDRLWAPWRSSYVSTKKRRGCIFCIGKDRKKDAGLFVVRRTKLSFSILNIFPYNNGHILIAPYRHIKNFRGLRDEEMLDMMRLLKQTKIALDKILKPDGYNIGFNIGRASGAGIKGHIHLHIVPRWNGDTNFITTISGSKVISQSLTVLYKELKRVKA